jgi:hypothetical protein
LYLRAESQLHGVEVWFTGHDREGAEGVRYAIVSGKLVETTYTVLHYFTNHEFWYAAKRKSVDSGAITLLNCTDGTLDLTYVIIGGNRIEVDWKDVLTDAFKLIVCM